MKSKCTIALAGNPNCGKTTLFNALTGGHQHIGNYPGVTVEKKEGSFTENGHTVHVIDLPGMYDLNAHSPEEVVARDVLHKESPSLIVCVVDASNLERNLFLTSQLMELGIPLLVVLNMSDTAEKKGYIIHKDAFSKALGVPVIQTIGHKSKGISTLKKTILDLCLNRITHTNQTNKNTCMDSCTTGSKSKDEKKPTQKIASAEDRYQIIDKWLHKTVTRKRTTQSGFTEKLDEVLTHPFWGVLVFLGLMYIVFSLVFVIGAPFMEWIEQFFAWITGIILTYWPITFAPFLRSLLVDGIIGGVGGVIVFLPNILLLFLAIAFLEGTGYMSRVAFVMDRFMNKIQLHGKSIVPMLLGFGCSVPAIMATRTLESKQERMTTMMVLPLMSCGARLTIYALIIPAFFPASWQGPMLWIMYFIGILVAVVVAKLLRKTIFKGDTVPFLIELPDYRMPTFKSIIIEMWNQSKEYLKKAGTIILVLSVVLWLLATYPSKTEYTQNYSLLQQNIEQSSMEEADKNTAVAELQQEKQEEELSYTFAGRIGHALEPVIKPLGFDWKIGTALIGALAAKEMFVAQLGIVNAVGEADENSIPLRDKLKDQYTPLIAFCIMLFCLISAPCVATCAVTRRESNSWKWALIQFGGLTVLAYVITLAVYQIGSLLYSYIVI